MNLGVRLIPGASKDIEGVRRVQDDLDEIVAEMKQVICVKVATGTANLVCCLIQQTEVCRTKSCVLNSARSDEIHYLMAEKGIVLEDTKDGARCNRK